MSGEPVSVVMEPDSWRLNVISQGDGKMQRLLDNNQCPKCQTVIDRQAIGKTLADKPEQVYQCKVCKLILAGCDRIVTSNG